MNCAKLEKLIPDYLYADLLPEERYEFEQHLADCRKCAQLLKEYQQLRGFFSKLDEQEFPQKLEADILRRARNVAPGKPSFAELLKTWLVPRPTVGMGLAAAVALSIFIIYNYPKLSKEARTRSSITRQEPVPSVPEMGKQKVASIRESKDESATAPIFPQKAREVEEKIDKTQVVNIQKEADDKLALMKEVAMAEKAPIPIDSDKTHKRTYAMQQTAKPDVVVPSIKPSMPAPAEQNEGLGVEEQGLNLDDKKQMLASNIPQPSDVSSTKGKYFRVQTETISREVVSKREVFPATPVRVSLKAAYEPEMKSKRLAKVGEAKSDNFMQRRSRLKKMGDKPQETEESIAQEAAQFPVSASRSGLFGYSRGNVQTARNYISKRDYSKAYEMLIDIINNSKQAEERMEAWKSLRVCVDRLKNYSQALDFIYQYEIEHYNTDLSILSEMKAHFEAAVSPK